MCNSLNNTPSKRVRVVKDGSGTVRERFDYYPYGTVSRAWTSSSTTDNSGKRFRFGGKEIAGAALTDLSGTGPAPSAPYLDFGARLYSPRTATWLSPDPMAEKYYGISPFVYCAASPGNLVDPGGADWYIDTYSGYYTWFEGNEDRDGFLYYGPRGSLLGEGEDLIDYSLTRRFNSQSLYSEGFSLELVSNNKKLFAPGRHVFTSGVFGEFVSNTGPEFSVFLPEHDATKALQKESMIMRVNDIINATNNSALVYGQRLWTLKDVLTTTSLPQQFIGSYHFLARRSTSGSFIYNLVGDSKSRTSLFYHGPGITNRNRGESSMFGNTYQFYLWITPR